VASIPEVSDHETVPAIELRPLTMADPARIAQAFAELGWPGKTVDQYRRYLDEQEAGTRAVFVAWWDGGFAGYLTVRWSSDYAPFRVAGVPEIVDLNVLPQCRRRRIASTLMDAAEGLIASRSDTAGIGVGLYADYAAAHAMYLRRGCLPDGRGVAYRGANVGPGAPVRVDDDLALMMVRRLR
jgi:GNAT superfamily N-acetyltransferase